MPILSTTIALIAFSPVVVALCAYVGYPAALWIVTALRRTPSYSPRVFEWPSITITVPVYNAGSSIRVTLDHLIELDYPRERLQILVISDASDDATDDIVRSFAKHGVELLRIPERRGKTAAENAALAVARGDILVNVDSTILVPSHSLKNLVRVFEDPEIGVASGRDVSMGEAKNNGTRAESSYVGYEMWIRELETKVGSIVGASGCFYASRRNIHATALPPGLSWDFASALNAQLQGYRSVSVGDAICVVPRATEVRSELRRKVRTMARGLGTLFFYRGLMNPFKHGGFAVMLVTHKLLRWVPYLLAPIAFVALCILALWSNTAFVALGIASAGVALGIVGINWRWSQTPKPIALAGFVVAVFTAGFLAWISALRNTQLATWEPTERPRLADQNQQPLKTQLSV